MSVATRGATGVLAAMNEYADDVISGRVIAGRLVRLACERHKRDLDLGSLRGLTFDEDAATHAVEFFGHLRHVKGALATRGGQPVHLDDWQVFVIGSLFGWKRADGFRRFRRVYLSVARKNGKALALDTPIPTPDGWTTMGEIETGDVVFDERGMPCRVTYATDVMHGRDCYRVRFSDGSSIVADAEHLWQTTARRNGTSRGTSAAATGVRTTREIACTLAVNSPYNVAHGRVEWNHRIAVAEPLQCEPVELPIDPYLLGAWLGDGHSAAALITTVDAEILRAIETAGTPIRQLSTPITYGIGNGDRSQLARNNSIQARLRSLGVLNNKHIPGIYQRASIQQRMALLRGLMDTDGYVSRAGQCEFVTTSEMLSLDVFELLAGLGFKPTETMDRARINGRDCGERYRIQFWAYDDRPVFSLARKRERQKPPPKSETRASTRQIVAAESVESVPVRCIQVDSPSHLYLVGASMIPTHNTTIAAGIGLYLAFFDGEPGAEVYAAATTADQARICWDIAKQMVGKSPDLARRITTLAHRLVREDSASYFAPISKEADSQEGKSPHGAIIDEYHAHVSGELASVLELGTGARRQPLMLFTTTAGTDGESPCRDMDRDCIAILEQNVDADDVFAYIARLDDGDRWDDPAVWVKANPGLGSSVRLDNLETACEAAKRTPRLQPEFIRKRCNRWAQQEQRWIHLEDWDECGDLPCPAQGAVCYAGLDLSSTTDLTAFVAAFPDGAGGYDVLPMFWIPEENIQEKADRDGAPYQAWVDAGYVQTTEGNITDYDQVREYIREFATEYQLREIPFDRWNATQLATQLTADGATLVQFPQGFSTMNEPARLLESLILTRRIRHGGNPVLRWMMANVAVKAGPNDTIRPVKGNERARIDGIVALVMALGRAMVHAETPTIEAHLW